MNKKIAICLIVLLFSVEIYAKGGGGGSFGNNDKISKFPTKKITNVKNRIPGLKNGEHLYINAKVVVRTRNFFWVPTWKSGYAELKITKDRNKPHKVNRLTVIQVEPVNFILIRNTSTMGSANYTSDIQFHWGLDNLWNALVHGGRLSTYPVTFNNGHIEDTLGYNQNRYTIPYGYNRIPGHYASKNNASSLKISLRDPNAPVVTFFNVKILDNLGFAFTLTNKWGGGGSIPMMQVGSF